MAKIDVINRYSGPDIKQGNVLCNARWSHTSIFTDYGTCDNKNIKQHIDRVLS